ncbi:MAG: hypothetical protein LBH31_08100 [Burkholderiaceae bacterium]|jgi:hypothetical protein|nr:hypothetical protein [Burkholderiaceae bacterium]
MAVLLLRVLLDAQYGQIPIEPAEFAEREWAVIVAVPHPGPLRERPLAKLFPAHQPPTNSPLAAY